MLLCNAGFTCTNAEAIETEYYEVSITNDIIINNCNTWRHKWSIGRKRDGKSLTHTRMRRSHENKYSIQNLHEIHLAVNLRGSNKTLNWHRKETELTDLSKLMAKRRSRPYQNEAWIDSQWVVISKSIYILEMENIRNEYKSIVMVDTHFFDIQFMALVCFFSLDQSWDGHHWCSAHSGQHLELLWCWSAVPSGEDSGKHCRGWQAPPTHHGPWTLWLHETPDWTDEQGERHCKRHQASSMTFRSLNFSSSSWGRMSVELFPHFCYQDKWDNLINDSHWLVNTCHLIHIQSSRSLIQTAFILQERYSANTWLHVPYIHV